MPSWSDCQTHAAAGLTAAAGMGEPCLFAPAFGDAVELMAVVQAGNTPILLDGSLTVSQDVQRVMLAAEDLAQPPQRGDRLQLDGAWYGLDQEPYLSAAMWQCVIRAERA